MPPDSEFVETAGSVGVAVNSVRAEVTQSGKIKKSPSDRRSDHVTASHDFIAMKCKLLQT